MADWNSEYALLAAAHDEVRNVVFRFLRRADAAYVRSYPEFAPEGKYGHGHRAIWVAVVVHCPGWGHWTVERGTPSALMSSVGLPEVVRSVEYFIGMWRWGVRMPSSERAFHDDFRYHTTRTYGLARRRALR